MTLTRRVLFTTLLGGGGAVAAGSVVGHAAPRVPVTEYPTYAHPLFAEGLRLYWSGWKGSQQYQWLVGQWFAWPEPLTPDPFGQY